MIIYIKPWFYFFRHSKKSSKSHRSSRSRSPNRESSSTITDKDRKLSQVSTSQSTPVTTVTNEPLDKVRFFFMCFNFLI